MRQLTDDELSTISNLAQTAGEKFEQNARELRAAVVADGVKAGYEQLAKQFDKQATEARAIAIMFGDMPPVVIGNCPACMAADPNHSSRDCPDRRSLALIE